MNEKRTDLAYERYSAKRGAAITAEESRVGACRLHSLTVEKENGDIPAGRHLTLFFPPAQENPFSEGRLLSDALFSLLSKECERRLAERSGESFRVLFAGLGNASVTVDSFGPAAAAHIRATAHLKKELPSLFSLLSMPELAVFSPGVSSESGIESRDLLASVIACFRPHLLLVADSLVACTPEHLGRTLQISDAGIRPGSGIRRPSGALDAAFAGCPVLSIGMPTALAGESLLAETPPDKSEEQNKFPCGHFFAPASIDASIAEGARAVAGAVERLFGIPE